jgi:hypothetical protein
VDESACKKAKVAEQIKEAESDGKGGGADKGSTFASPKALKVQIGKDLIKKSGIVALAMAPEVEDGDKSLGSWHANQNT